MKALIPAGYMIGTDSSVLAVQICADSFGHAVVKQIAIPQPQHAPVKQTRIDGVCAFTALGHAALGGTGTIQLALAPVFILAVDFAPLVAPRSRGVRSPRWECRCGLMGLGPGACAVFSGLAWADAWGRAFTAIRQEMGWVKGQQDWTICGGVVEGCDYAAHGHGAANPGIGTSPV